ncbi:MAG: hypothetical protein ABEJ57_08305 [Halobacteriaceae archaeon]
MSGCVDGGDRLAVEDATDDDPTVTTTVGDVVSTTTLQITAEDLLTVHPIDAPSTTVDDTVTVPRGGTRITVGTDPELVVGFDAPATITPTATGVDLAFESATRVRVTAPTAPRPTIAVPPTPDGAATAVTYAASAHLLEGPGRSHPAFRSLPPRVELAEDTTVPDTVRAVAPDTAAHITVPLTIETVAKVAPLAYYLGASVETAAGADPVLEGQHTTIPLAPIAEVAPTLLETVFHLDCRLRSADSPPVPGLDVASLRTAAPIDRLSTYRDVDIAAVLAETPPWHLAAYLAPTPDAITAIPTVLDRLAHVYAPTAEPLAPQTLMERSLDDFYRSPRPTPTVDLVEPSLQPAAAHAWVADDVPVDAFRLPTHIAARVGTPTPSTDPPLEVLLVLNDPAMVGEEDAVTDTYRNRSAVPVDLDRRRELTCTELEMALTADVDLLHFMGHCEPDGLVCTDGTLPSTAIHDVGPRTVFLNACGSYHEGAALVDGGATAAAVTYRGVLDGQAETVGSAFARLVTRGFSLERTVGLARRRVMMGMDYGVVGDGTHRLTRAVDPVRYVIDPTDTGYDVTCETFADGIVGDAVTVPLPGVDSTRFRGGSATRTLDFDGVTALLDRTDAPVIYDGSFAWPEDLLDTLRVEHDP